MNIHLPQSSVSRFAVVGTTGSGKSTLAQRLSKHLGIPYNVQYLTAGLPD